MSRMQQFKEQQLKESIIDHLEGYLGTIAGGWSFGESAAADFQIARFDNGLISEIIALSTIGLSNFDLSLADTGKSVRQEFILLFRSGEDPGSRPGIIREVAMDVLRTRRAHMRGDVIGPRGPLISESTCEALYVAEPAYYPEEFSVFRRTGAHPVIIAWLVPITAREAEFVAENGGARFEDELHASDPDLMDFSRESIV